MSTTTSIPAPVSNIHIQSLEWILNHRLRWLFHVFFWILIYLDEFLAVIGITPPLSYPVEDAFTLMGDLVMVYINLYYLIPRFLLQNKIWIYLLLSTIVLGLNIAMVQALYHYPDGYDGYPPLVVIISDSVSTLTLLGTAIAIKLFKTLLNEQQRRQEAEKMSLETELAYLKDQVNPHFLFNALNNLYVQIRKRPKEAAESVLLLSDLLRYQLYDAAKGQVYLSSEIDYLNNYLELDKMRREQLEVKFEVVGTPNGKNVAPYLFLPFVENAVKHGAGVSESAFIHLKFDITDKYIAFSVANSKPEHKPNHPVGGIGLGNVKRRLELLYPKQHRLNIKETEQQYLVELLIEMEV